MSQHNTSCIVGSPKTWRVVGRNRSYHILRVAREAQKQRAPLPSHSEIAAMWQCDIKAVSVHMHRLLIKENVAPSTHVMTDEAGQYAHLNKHFAAHDYARHGAGEYGRGKVHTNTVEGFYSVFKRGMKGVYQHCAEKHLHRYVAEFDFRYNNRAKLGVDDEARSARALQGAVGKRLTYRRVGNVT